MKGFIYEWRLFQRSRLSIIALLLLSILATMAVWSGLHEVKRQQQTITHLAELHEQDVAAIAEKYAKSDSAGNPAYYTFYNTWDSPSDTAFLALGLRDVAPYVLRIRALGLQAQLYEGEVFNPELALSGKFDFVFVLIYLSPLFVIALLHDLVSIERQSGRLGLLLSLPEGKRIWLRRIILNYGLLSACLIVPMIIGLVITGASISIFATLIVIVLSYLAFWVGLTLLIVSYGWRSVTNATALIGSWILLTLVLPTLANIVLSRAIPVHQGVDLMLAQRQLVHGAWEIPREETMQHFYSMYPEWDKNEPLPEGFQWKWYFAFHQVGDDRVAEQVKSYRNNLVKRQEWTEKIGWFLPSVGAQAAFHQLASTDLLAQLRYQDQIIDFHRQIREYYYPYLFNDLPFGTAEFKTRPVYQPQHYIAGIPHMTMLLIMCWLFAGLGLKMIYRNSVRK